MSAWFQAHAASLLPDLKLLAQNGDAKSAKQAAALVRKLES
jgi:hypothetical protein